MLSIKESLSPILWLTTTTSHSGNSLEVYIFGFITDLPVSKGFDTILTVVDRFTKMSHFLPCTKLITSQETTDLVMQQVFKHHGLPDDIISDRGPQFISKFWKHMFKLLHISVKLSSG